MDSSISERLKGIPQVQKLLESSDATALIDRYSLERVVEAIRACLETVRAGILSGSGSFSTEDLFERVAVALEASHRPRLRRVINATGVAIHTNLGRSPLADEAIEAIQATARGYSNLEFDLDSGKRGSRQVHVENLLCSLTGAEAALTVNNNAAAVTLAVNTLALGREVIVSRGELIEIGGSFRIPDVISRSGGRVLEVGSTNRTRAADYEGAISDDTGIFLKVCPSNFWILGFTEGTSRESIVALGEKYEIPVIEDVGSGTLVDLSRYGLPHETTVQEVVDSGVDVVTFSGDKLLGGPQAGILLGKRDPIEKMRKNPLMRALRRGKLGLAALEATLRLYLDEDRLSERLPLLRMMSTDQDAFLIRAQALREGAASIPGVSAAIENSEGFAGGGSLPDQAVPTKVVVFQVEGLSPNGLLDALRANDPPIVARISGDRVHIDLLCVHDSEAPEILEALRSIAS